MAFLNLNRERREPLDLDAIRRGHPLPDVVAGAGVVLKRAGSELKACCPFHGERTPSFTIYSGGDRWHCFGCGSGGDLFDFIAQLHGVGLREAADLLTGGNLPSVTVALLPIDDGPDRSEEARAIWAAAVPIGGTVAEAYLRNRGLHLPLPDALRFASLRFGRSGPEHPVLVAAVTGADGAIGAIQRTYLRPDGTGKADVPAPRLSLGKLAGGAVRLTPPARSLILTEGTEDALSLIQTTGRATWAALGTSNLAKVVLPLNVEDVVIGADNDPAGEAAAQKAAQAYAEKGCRTRIIRPLPGFKDWNAELQNTIQEAR